MFYVRYANCQSHFTSKQDAWACAKKLHCDLDIYDSESKSVVFATYRLSEFKDDNWVLLGFARSLAPLRDAYKQAQPTVWALSRYDWDSKSWTSVKHS